MVISFEFLLWLVKNSDGFIPKFRQRRTDA